MKGTLLAFDFGTVRIGVATGELETRTAQPLTVLHGEANATRFAAIEQLIREWQPVALVVGRPTAMDGTPHAMTARCERFARQLHGRFGLPLHFADERLSSVEAEAVLRERKVDAKRARDTLDALAAQRILQHYLDNLPT